MKTNNLVKRSSSHFKSKESLNNPTLRTGLVIATHGANIEVEDEKKHRYTCISRKKIGMAVCGDQVRWHNDPNQTGLIHEITPRKNLLARPDARNKLKPVAANIDYLAITLAPTPTAIQNHETEITQNTESITLLDFHAIDRYIVAAEMLNIQAFIIINKIDLLSEDLIDGVKSRLSSYSQLGYPFILTSTKHNIGIKELNNQLKDNISVFVGQSGVGKSSLIRIFVAETNIQVGSISKVTGQGRHTTTATRLYHLKSGGYIIDSPGVREFGLWNIEAASIMCTFKEFKPFIGTCKFNNCLHTSEPHCAIKKAVHDKIITSERYMAYTKILASLNDLR